MSFGYVLHAKSEEIREAVHADNIDTSTETIDGRNTFHGKRMISAVTPAIKHTSRKKSPCSSNS